MLPQLDDDGGQRQEVRVLTDGVKVVLSADEIAVVGVEFERLREKHHGPLGVASEAPVAGQVVVDDRLAGIHGHRVFQGLDGQIQLAGALVAQPSVSQIWMLSPSSSVAFFRGSIASA